MCLDSGLFWDIFTVILFVMWCMWGKKIIEKIKNYVGNYNSDVSKYIWGNNPLVVNQKKKKKKNR